MEGSRRTLRNLRHLRSGLAMLSAAVAVCLGAAPARAGAPAPGAAPAAAERTVLGNDSLWRCHLVNRQPLVRKDGKLEEVVLHAYQGVWGPKTAKDLPPATDTPVPPADWTSPDFDDLAWSRRRGPFFPTRHNWAWNKEVDNMGLLGYEETSPVLAAICVRGRFTVTDPAAAGELKLSLVYRGGVVVHLNGQEIARANIPEAGKAEGVLAPAEDYPDEAFVRPEGGAIGNYTDAIKNYERLKLRVRRLSDVKLPAKLLRKGQNVLAIEAHRTPYNAVLLGKGRGGSQGYVINWATVGIVDLSLTGGGPGVEPNVGRPKGIEVWNQPVDARPEAADHGSSCEPLRPIRLVGARNGSFSGSVVLGSGAPLRNAKAAAGELKGPGTIPASAVQVRYALADPDTKLSFDMLSPDAPAEVAADKAGGALLPVWVTVRVPAEAKPGDYRGTLTVSAEGAKPVEVPVSLRVTDWTLPDPKQFVSHVGLTESPESVAMRYDVPLWSEKHWKLLDEVFALMGQAGADDVFITAIRRTHYGNEHAMIRRVKGPDGKLGVDLSVAEKYLDLAIKHLGKVPVVCIYCWEPFTGSVYGGKDSKPGGVPLPYTVVNPETGELTETEGPAWGTPEVREFWKPVFDAVREMLKKRGLEGSLMVGVAGDSRPKKDAVEDLKAIAPDARWVIQSHMQGNALFGQPVGYLADVWAIPSPANPAGKRVYGWQNPVLRTAFPRAGSALLLRPSTQLFKFRTGLELASTAGFHGFGRVGVDFWNVLKTPNRTYGKGLSLVAHYPQSDWGQLYLGNSCACVLASGPKGPLATARFEMIREGAQDVEARVFIEKALLDPANRAKLGDDLANRAQQMLDDRVRAILTGQSSWLLYSGSEGRLERLYELAGEVAGKLGK